MADLFSESTEAWLTPTAFLCSSFVPLETLTSGLRAHQASLKSHLIHLLSRNYNDFVALANQLAAAAHDDAASRVRNPLAEFSDKELAPLRTATAAQLVEFTCFRECFMYFMWCLRFCCCPVADSTSVCCCPVFMMAADFPTIAPK